MCGRFVLFTTGEQLLTATTSLPGVTQASAPQGIPDERYNIAPTQTIPVVRVDDAGHAVIELARWGLFPQWKKDDKGAPLFNARAETVAEKPSFRSAFAHKRCLIPMDGYYEWHAGETNEASKAGKKGKGKQPYFVSREGGEVMWAAGLWDSGLDQLSATIITTDSLSPIEWLHDRMPRFLTLAEALKWCRAEKEEAEEMLHPTPKELRGKFVTRAVDKRVGTVANDDPELLAEQ